MESTSQDRALPSCQGQQRLGHALLSRAIVAAPDGPSRRSRKTEENQDGAAAGGADDGGER